MKNWRTCIEKLHIKIRYEWCRRDILFSNTINLFILFPIEILHEAVLRVKVKNKDSHEKKPQKRVNKIENINPGHQTFVIISNNLQLAVKKWKQELKKARIKDCEGCFLRFYTAFNSSHLIRNPQYLKESRKISNCFVSPLTKEYI